jgi:hypothetical protein
LISEASGSGTNSKDSLLVLEDPTTLHVRKRGHKTNPGSDNSVPSRCHAWADFQIVFLVRSNEIINFRYVTLRNVTLLYVTCTVDPLPTANRHFTVP